MAWHDSPQSYVEETYGARPGAAGGEIGVWAPGADPVHVDLGTAGEGVTHDEIW